MTIKEAHEKAVQDDRMLIVQGAVSGKWYKDHVLDFVAEHGEDECILLMDGDVTVTVTRIEGQAAGRRMA